MVPICSRLLHTPSITGPSPWLAAGEKGNRHHISLCGSHLLHYRMHTAHKSTPCKLQPLEAPHFCPDTVSPPHVCYRIRCRQPMRDKPRLHGCRAPSRHDIHRICANHHLFQCYNDEASEWQSSFDRGTIYAGQFLGPFISPLLILMYTSTGAWDTKVLPGLGPGGFGELYRRIFMQLGLSIFLPLVRTNVHGPT